MLSLLRASSARRYGQHHRRASRTSAPGAATRPYREPPRNALGWFVEATHKKQQRFLDRGHLGEIPAPLQGLVDFNLDWHTGGLRLHPMLNDGDGAFQHDAGGRAIRRDIPAVKLPNDWPCSTIRTGSALGRP